MQTLFLVVRPIVVAEPATQAMKSNMAVELEQTDQLTPVVVAAVAAASTEMVQSVERAALA
jgi:hypothetical protein